eukprot:GHVR01070417.1.p1 GENE.GHVR01070417.1~~GHVR01070417.1.p1  ORF type:complete len:103 (-),score=10.06 GHVR01070417.1:92-400(-)
MAGKGKIGKQATKGKKYVMPSRKIENPAITGGAIRRLARRGGVKRISPGTYPGTREYIDDFLGQVVKDSATYAEHARRTTITAMDVVYALKRSGKVIYGYGA